VGNVPPYEQKPEKIMAKQLVDIDIPEAEPASKKNVIPVIPVEGDTVTRYNEASDQMKASKAVMDELRAELVQKGLEYLFAQNVINPAKPMQSVRLMTVDADLPDNNETLTVTWTKKAVKCVPAAVKDWFAKVKTVLGKVADINLYTEWVVTAKFDTSIFNNPKTGKFDRARYDKVQIALIDVAAELGADNPVTCGKVLVPTDAFNEGKRWSDFTAEQNMELTDVLPTVVTLEPVRQNGEDADKKGKR
jgi:hypothetical protein